MFLHLNSAQKEIQEKVRTLVASEIAPKAGEIDARDEFPETSYEAFVRAGLLKLSLPAAFGGKEADATSLCLVIEEISKASPASALLVFPTNAVVRTIREVGTPEQKERFFSEMSPGDKLCGFCLTEPNHGSDAGSLQTRAVLEGDHYVVNGTKSFITLGPHAHYYLVFVRTGPGKRTGGVSALIVPRDTPGLVFWEKGEENGIRGIGHLGNVFSERPGSQRKSAPPGRRGVEGPVPTCQCHAGLGGGLSGPGDCRRGL